MPRQHTDFATPFQEPTTDEYAQDDEKGPLLVLFRTNKRTVILDADTESIE